LREVVGGNENVRDTIQGNFAGRELAAYDLSKLLGVEGLIPPTREWGHQLGYGEGGYYSGSAQMGAHDFGKKVLGYESVSSPHGVDEIKNAKNEEEARLGLRSMFDKAKNGTDMVLFDFISGQTDRNTGNFFVAKGRKNGEYNFMGTDNGLSFPDHRGDIVHPD
jgi:hypothetical protein